MSSSPSRGAEFEHLALRFTELAERNQVTDAVELMRVIGEQDMGIVIWALARHLSSILQVLWPDIDTTERYQRLYEMFPPA
jgi:hypothetical protein